MIYKVSVKNTDLFENVKARSELEAKIKFCEGRGFMYRIFANKLEVEQKKKGGTNGQKRL